VDVVGHPTPAQQLDRAGIELVAKQILVAAPVLTKTGENGGTGTCETIHYFDASNLDKSIVFNSGNRIAFDCFTSSRLQFYYNSN
jgi:hypothetical protein